MPCCIYRDRNKVEIDPRGETGDLVTRLDCLLIARIVDKKRKREEKKRKNSVVARLINHRGQSIEIYPSVAPFLRVPRTNRAHSYENEIHRVEK